MTGSFFYNYSNQQLPGAVILYNPSNDQSLTGKILRADINLVAKHNNWISKINAFAQSHYTLYQDPYFLNAKGFWRSEYQQHRYGAGIITHRIINKGKISFGTDLYCAELSSSEFFNAPLRLGSNTVVSMEMKWPSLMLEGNLILQVIHDRARSGDTLINKWYVTPAPYLAFKWYPFKKQWFGVRASAKQVFRMPSFNDLYYNFIGNTNLQPERAFLHNFGCSYEFPLPKGNELEMAVDGFFNLVKNKIIAIPTKDIFNWSIGRHNILCPPEWRLELESVGCLYFELCN